MTFISILLFTLAVLIGLFLVVSGIRKQGTSLSVGLTHASTAIVATGFLATEIINGPINKYNNVAALLMVLALTGGAMLFALREPGKPPPMVLVAIHALMALAGLLLLVLGQK